MPDDETVNQMIARHEEEFDLFMVSTQVGVEVVFPPCAPSGSSVCHPREAGSLEGFAHCTLMTSNRAKRLCQQCPWRVMEPGVAPQCLLTDPSSMS